VFSGISEGVMVLRERRNILSEMVGWQSDGTCLHGQLSELKNLGKPLVQLFKNLWVSSLFYFKG
jgi:hypothetical protein